MLPCCERATLAFCLDPSDAKADSWLSIWSLVGKSYAQCRARVAALKDSTVSIQALARDPARSRFANNPALMHLEAHWTRPTVFTPHASRLTPPRLVNCANADAEATLAAREILRFVRRGGRFREAAVIVRNLDGYHKPLARAFRRYEIPFFLDRREGVAHHPLAELTRNALRTVAFDWQHEDWFAALKAGFAPVEESELDRLENALEGRAEGIGARLVMSKRGPTIESTMPNSPARKAGLKPGDQIVSLDGKGFSVPSSDDWYTPPGVPKRLAQRQTQGEAAVDGRSIYSRPAYGS